MPRFSLALAAALIAVPARAAPAARTFDLVTYTAPDGFTVAEQGDHVAITRVGAKSYCLIGIYRGTDAGADLDASFASEWANVVDTSVDPVAVPAVQHGSVGGAPAAIGAAMTTTGGKPVLAMLTTIDAGAKVVSILVLTPNQDDLKVYTPSITALANSLAIRRVEPPARAAPAAPAAPAPGGKTITRMGGKITVPNAPRGLTLADLDGEWTNGYESATTYVDAQTGVYAGYTANVADKKWVVSAKKGTIESHTVGTHAGAGGTFQAVEDFRYKAQVTPDGDLVMIRAAGDNKTFEDHYLVKGWQVGPQLTIMVLGGDYYDQPIPDAERRDFDKGGNLDTVWFRVVKNTKEK